MVYCITMCFNIRIKTIFFETLISHKTALIRVKFSLNKIVKTGLKGTTCMLILKTIIEMFLFSPVIKTSHSKK